MCKACERLFEQRRREAFEAQQKLAMINVQKVIDALNSGNETGIKK
jgi:hypothetical protein